MTLRWPPSSRLVGLDRGSEDKMAAEAHRLLCASQPPVSHVLDYAAIFGSHHLHEAEEGWAAIARPIVGRYW